MWRIITRVITRSNGNGVITRSNGVTHWTRAAVGAVGAVGATRELGAGAAVIAAAI